ncbi:MAG: hypothetical protein ABH826_03760 [Patescibacteria group bacterium]|nr:hypothetical protein [Patescibacteria group bacterium]
MAFAPNEKKLDTAPLPEQNFAFPETDVETTAEANLESREGKAEQQEKEEVVETVGEFPSAPPPQVVPAKDPTLKNVEDILAEDLTDIFLQLPEEKRSAFKLKGEEIAQKIQVMIVSGKVKVKRVLDLIREWLSMIPGVNKFFLEQESKIKTDRIISFVEDRAKMSENTM